MQPGGTRGIARLLAVGPAGQRGVVLGLLVFLIFQVTGYRGRMVSRLSLGLLRLLMVFHAVEFRFAVLNGLRVQLCVLIA